MSEKKNTLGLLPRGVVKLDTLANVRAEMSRLYRLALKGDLETGELTRFVYALKEIRACIETMALEDIARRLDELSGVVERRGSNGHSITDRQAHTAH